MSFFSRLTKILQGEIVKKKPKRKFLAPRPVKLPKVIPTEEIEEARARAREIIFEAKDKAFKIKQEVDREARQIQQETFRLKEGLDKEEAVIDRKTGILQERERLHEEREKKLEEKFSEIEKIKKQQLEKLERAASLTRDEAKKLILQATEKKLTAEIAKEIKEAEEKAKEGADKKAREILVEAMQRGATDYVPEYTVSTVKLPDEDMKGRVIGREGRNIRTFEKITGIDVDLDEEGVIRLSSFDPVRREIARTALERLIADGRIQPSRIEEIVEKTQKDINRIMRQAGEDLCHRLKVYNLPQEVVDILGRFRYRFSYGQNMIAHTLEETKIGIALAHETKANINVVRLGCLLHDIGKVITDEEGTHVQIGVDFLRKYNIPQEVLDCIAQHHQDEPFTSTEAVLVYIADAISGSRPGARYEDYEEYAARLKKLEDLAESFKGVKEAYAIQAGREVRVIVNSEKIDDAAAIKIAHDMRDKIKKELTYPGQVKVTVIRELRTTEVAE